MSQPSKPDGILELAPGVWVDKGAVRHVCSRSSKPGGQTVNKLSTRVQLRVPVTAIVGLSPQAAQRLRSLAGRRLTKDDELVLVASGTRSQLENKRACLQRLRALVAEAIDVPRPRKATRPSRAAVERRLAEKRRASDKKETRRPPDEDS